MSVITNVSQLAPPPPPKRKKVTIDGLFKNDGSPAELYVQRLTAYEFGLYQESLRDENATLTSKTYRHNNLKFIACVYRDNNGNQLWQTAQEAIDQLGQYEQVVIDDMYAKAVEMNTAGEEAVARAEKNSGKTRSGSSNGTSPSTSESPTLVS